MAKTGTTTTSEAFRAVGLKQTYHGRDVKMHVWRSLADEYWRRPENGGNGDPSSIATVRPPANLPMIGRSTNSDEIVRENMRLEDLAGWISKCRVEAMTFDGHEALFWPVYDVSPGVKVVVLSWRTYEEWSKSLYDFSMKGMIWAYSMAYLFNCIHLMPWGVILFPTLDAISGGAIDSWYRNGGQMSVATGIPLTYVANQLGNRHVGARRNGIAVLNFTKESYYAWFDEVRTRVPAKDRIEWNVKKNTLKDLCDLLGIHGHPGCEKPMPKAIPGTWNFQDRLYFMTMAACYIAMHIVNYKIIWGTVGLCVGLLKGSGKSKGE